MWWRTRSPTSCARASLYKLATRNPDSGEFWCLQGSALPGPWEFVPEKVRQARAADEKWPLPQDSVEKTQGWGFRAQPASAQKSEPRVTLLARIRALIARFRPSCRPHASTCFLVDMRGTERGAPLSLTCEETSKGKRSMSKPERPCCQEEAVDWLAGC